MTPQTVAETADVETKSQTEETGAQEPSIDELLKQFEATETPTEQPKPEAISADDLKDFVRTAKDDRDERIREKTDADIVAATKVVKGDLEIDDGLIKDFLYGRASSDPRFLKAFQMRHQNPDAWAGVQKALGRELASKMVKPDQNLTDDRAAVEASVRSHSTGSADDSPPDFNSMTNAEFDKWERENIKRA